MKLRICETRWGPLLLVTGTLIIIASVQTVRAEHRTIERIEKMPNLPTPFKMRDWKVVAQGYDRLVFDFNAKGEHLPLIWWDNGRVNVDRPTFGLPSYVGSPHNSGAGHEAINCLAAVLGATLAGIDKSKGEHNWVLMTEAYFNSKNGQNLVLNNTSAGTGASFWYELYPHFLFYGLADRYPDVGNLQKIMRTTADRWYDACVALGGKDGTINFEHTAFNFGTMKAADNGKWKEPDAAGAVSWVQYMAWTKFKDPKFLEAAGWCQQWLNERKTNPHYEALMPMGAYVAARMNAEQGREYDVQKLLTWCFEPSAARPGWGTIAERWGEYDCHGLVGSITDGGGYAFAMNTFEMAGVLAPVARYDDRYARAIGKWMLNAANAARLFYADGLPPEQQTCPGWAGDPEHVIAYEGLRKEGLEYARRTPRFKEQRVNGKLPAEAEQQWKNRRPFALGDPSQYNWGPKTDFGLYGSSCVGFFAAIIARTNEECVLQLDLLATDFFHAPAYPTYLYYNPYPGCKAVQLDVGPQPKALYDTVSKQFVRENATGTVSLSLGADGAAVIVIAPAGGKVTRDGNRTLVDGIVVDYRAGEAR
ncbi:MAG: hypothetical protein NTW87_28845 [Planctomycetota bacterium]|nr:hypothetical protein [Planctomycetota bacterium]